MTEEIAGFETAKLAKEKGFNEYCTAVYQQDETLRFISYWEGANEEQEGVIKNDAIHDIYGDQICTAPTQSLLQTWLRRYHHIHLLVELDQTMEPKFCFSVYQYKIGQSVYKNLLGLAPYSELFYTYEKAIEDGLLWALSSIPSKSINTGS